MSVKSQKRRNLFPETILGDDLVHDLRQATEVSRERTRAELSLQSSTEDKRDTLSREYKAWTYGIYQLVRGSLRDHLQYALAPPPPKQAASRLKAWKWAQGQVAAALLQLGGKPRMPLGGAAMFWWCRQYASEWLKLAYDDPCSGIAVFIGWQAPSFAGTPPGSASGESGRATAQDTEMLLDIAASQLATALQDARYDALHWSVLTLSTPKIEPELRSEQKEAIAKIFMADEHASDQEVLDRLDDPKREKQVPVPPKFKAMGCQSWADALAKDEKGEIPVLISKVRNVLREAGYDCRPKRRQE